MLQNEQICSFHIDLKSGITKINVGALSSTVTVLNQIVTGIYQIQRLDL